MRSRRHYYTTHTIVSTSLRRYGEHNRTQPLPGLLSLTSTPPTGWRCRTVLWPYWPPFERTSEHSATRLPWSKEGPYQDRPLLCPFRL